MSISELENRLIFYVINLDRSVDRLECFAKNFAEFPIPFIRVPAIDGKTLTYPIKDYDAFMFFLRTGRDPTPGEIGCFLSHVKALHLFLESGKDFAIICEDDAMPLSTSYEAVEQAITHSKSWDLLRLFGCRKATTFPYLKLSDEHNLATSITDLTPAAAYMVSQHAAGVLVKKLLPMTSLYDDALFHGNIGVREATVWPNCFSRSEFSNTSTLEYNLRRNLKPWNLVYWTCRLYRLYTRIVRYTLQMFRVIRRRFAV